MAVGRRKDPTSFLAASKFHWPQPPPHRGCSGAQDKIAAVNVTVFVSASRNEIIGSSAQDKENSSGS